MSNVITYGLIAIVLLVLGFTVIMGLAKVKRMGSAAPKPKSGRGAHLTSGRMGSEQVEGGADNLSTSMSGLKVKGAVKKGAQKNIGKIVNEHPEETIDLIRNWLHGNNNENND